MARKICIGLLALLGGAALAAQPGVNQFHEVLSGFEEVPAISTSGNGAFSVRISNDETSVSWELSYADLEGDVAQSHIHLGQAGVNGGVFVFLCSNLGNGPPGTQTCPPPPATISGSFSAAEIVGGAAAQGIAPGELHEVIRAMRAGKTYVNVHSSLFPGGEIRAQIDPGRGN
jgi:hypothetical protein